MTGFLASVRNLAEARAALTVGVDVLDLKNPEDGALGALDVNAIKEVVAYVAGRTKVSATAGNLSAAAKAATDKIITLETTGVDFIKVGFFSPAYLESYPGKLRTLTARFSLVGVLFADRLADFAGPCETLARAGFVGVMLDTANKNSGSIRSLLTLEQLAAFVKRARSLSLLCGIAGALRYEDIKYIAPLGADYLGFRTALCANNLRVGDLCPKETKRIKSRLQEIKKRQENHSY